MRALGSIADEYRDQRVALGLTQAHVANAVGISRPVYSRIEAGDDRALGVVRAAQLASVLGLELSVRVFPGGVPMRDSAHAARLERLLATVSPPLTWRREVPLPGVAGTFERRAWDAMIMGLAKRTGIELEMRVRDSQALERRLRLKLRDDPVDQLLFLLADTRTNRNLLKSGVHLLGLPRLTIGTVTRALREGRHPPSGLVLV